MAYHQLLGSQAGVDSALYIRTVISVALADRRVTAKEREFIDMQAGLLSIDPTEYWKRPDRDLSFLDGVVVSRATSMVVVRDCIGLGYIDGTFSDSERAKVYDIAGKLGLTVADVDSLEMWLRELWGAMAKGDRLLNDEPAWLSLTWDHLIFVGGKKGLYGVDTRTGQLTWELRTDSIVNSTPVVAYGMAFFGCYNGRLCAVDLATRHEKWAIQTANTVWLPFAIGFSVLCFKSGEKTFCAVDVNTGQIKWEFETTSRILSSPTTIDRLVCFGTTDGKVYALDLVTGEPKWCFAKGDWTCSACGISLPCE